eukprot:3630316-Alexandrium_andersonii.AAC.1
MGTCVPVYGDKYRLAADCMRHAVAQQDPLLRWCSLGVWYGADVLVSGTPLSSQGVEHAQTVFVREICERDV